jgi:hypothetical protein
VGDGGCDVGADGGVSGLRDGQVVGARCEETAGRVERAQGEEGVCYDGEEVG